jgi:hypothetical protein
MFPCKTGRFGCKYPIAEGAKPNIDRCSIFMEAVVDRAGFRIFLKHAAASPLAGLNAFLLGGFRLPGLEVVSPAIGLSELEHWALMNSFRANMVDRHRSSTQLATLALLILANTAICCVSLVYCARFHVPGSPFNPTPAHILYDPTRLYEAILVAAAFALVSFSFLVAPFSFGYFVGFYLYTMVLGYLWLNVFSDRDYNHQLAGASAAASAVAFLWPALFISSPIRQICVLSQRSTEFLLHFILLLSVATIAIGTGYNFRLAALANIYDYREKLSSPTILNYLVGMTSSALLPFAFACFVTRRDWLRAVAVLVLLLLFYPITLTKIAFFTPLWLIFIVLLSKVFETRFGVVISLLVPTLAGVIFFTFFSLQTATYFGTVNFRMSAIPSVALDVYNDFFSRHDFTYFCQIHFLKPLMNCPYQEPLPIVMKKAYELGNFNASLFATEGIASVGPLFAPFIALICGFVIALGNRLSAGLPPPFIFISGAILPQIFVNVSLTTVLLTHGAGALFLLWYILPRTMFNGKTKQIDP